jgi:formamidopyrimidine-DNA glycosylase
VALRLEDGRTLWFSDMRKFGRLWLAEQPEAVLPELGPEPFDPALSAETLHESMQRFRRPIKSLLLDQAFLAGLGNIYADEALFLACIHPSRPASSLSLPETEALLAAMREVLATGIANRGTTIATYVDANGQKGENQERLQIYGRAGQACPRCHGEISRLRLAGRSAAFCPRCQPA